MLALTAVFGLRSSGSLFRWVRCRKSFLFVMKMVGNVQRALQRLLELCSIVGSWCHRAEERRRALKLAALEVRLFASDRPFLYAIEVREEPPARREQGRQHHQQYHRRGHGPVACCFLLHLKLHSTSSEEVMSRYQLLHPQRLQQTRCRQLCQLKRPTKID